jgi:hypothetical protein
MKVTKNNASFLGLSSKELKVLDYIFQQERKISNAPKNGSLEIWQWQ